MIQPIPDPIRLTQYAKRAGCAAKQAPDYLFAFLHALPKVRDPNVLVGCDTADDAAIYKLSEELALILTTDFFTPIVDDPYDFGAIAATNALSDIYAMGGKPLTALSLVGFPDALLPPSVLCDILRGAADKCQEAGIAIVGGHSIKAEEPIFGLAAVGSIHPAGVLTNSHAQTGDYLILTKPLGVGIITTAAKRGLDTQLSIAQAISQMKTLNNVSCDVLTRFNAVHALTDVTGFGLLGHLRNVLVASQASAEIYWDSVNVLSSALTYARPNEDGLGIVPGGTIANHRFLRDWVRYHDIDEPEQYILCDAQTSGGLLAAVAAEQADFILDSLHAAGIGAASIVGRITSGQPGVCDVYQSADENR